MVNRRSYIDFSLQNYESAANKNRESLSLLNISQALVIMFGITIMLIMTAYGIQKGVITIGGFVVVNAYMHFGNKAFNYFDGMWAIAIYDREKKQILVGESDKYEALCRKCFKEEN